MICGQRISWVSGNRSLPNREGGGRVRVLGLGVGLFPFLPPPNLLHLPLNRLIHSRFLTLDLLDTEVVEALESVPVTVPVPDGIVRFTVFVVSVGGE